MIIITALPIQFQCLLAMSLLFHFVVITVGCTQGTFQTVITSERVFNGEGIKERYPVCRPCSVNTYEDRVGSVSCKTCPDFYQTASTGSTSSDECFGIHTQALHHMQLHTHTHTRTHSHTHTLICCTIFFHSKQLILFCLTAMLVVLQLKLRSNAKAIDHHF